MTYTIDRAVNELKAVRMTLPVQQKLPDEQLLDMYEKLIGVKFTSEYRYFMKNASDSVYNGRDVLAITEKQDSPDELLNVINEMKRFGLPNGWIPLSWNNGDYFCVKPDGKIGYFSLDGASDEEWDSIATWIRDVWIGGQ